MADGSHAVEEAVESDGEAAVGVGDDGSYPDNVSPCAKTLYEKINRRYSWKNPSRAVWHGLYGPGICASSDTLWSLCIEEEENRRKLEVGKIDKLADHSDAATAEYRRDGKLVATLFGSGEKFGPWDAYTYLDVEADSRSGLKDLEVGYQVSFGPALEDGVVARILRSTKPAGSAAASKTQQCFLVLLYAGSKWKHATLQSIHFTAPFYYGRQSWVADTSTLESGLRDNFQPKSACLGCDQRGCQVRPHHEGKREQRTWRRAWRRARWRAW